MTGTTQSSAHLDPRRRKILFRAWHRGMREMDLILGSFADDEIATLSEAELDALDELMNENDQDLFKWIVGEIPVPTEQNRPIFRRILAHRKAMKF